MRAALMIFFVTILAMLTSAAGGGSNKKDDACKAKCEQEMLEYQKKAGNNPPATSFAIDSCVDQCKKGITLDGMSDVVALCRQACENVLMPMNRRNNPEEKKRCIDNCVEVAARNLINFLNQQKQPPK
jgi:hypothetical protein